MESGQIGLRQQLQKYFFPSRNINSKSPSQPTTPRTPTAAMNATQLPRSEAMTPSAAPWMTPTTQPQQPPTTMQESFSYYMKDETTALTPWGTSSSFQQRPTDALAQPAPISQDLFPVNMMNSHEHSKDPNAFRVNEVSDRWNQKPCEENFDIHVLDPDAPIGQAYTTDEAVPILDLRYTNSTQDVDHLHFDNNIAGRRMSGSSLTVSTNGGLSEMPSYEDFSAALSEAPSFNSDYPPTSNRNSMISSTQLSPVPSPRLTPQSRPEQVRAQSRGRASSPRPNMRVAPYNMDIPRSNKRWSTGSYGVIQRRSSPAVYNPHDHSVAAQRTSIQSLPPPPSGILPSSLPMNVGHFPPAARPPFMMPGNPAFQRNSMILPSQLPSQLPPQVPSHFFHHHEGPGFPQPPMLPSHGVLRILQSNGDPHTLTGRYTDLSDPPDLFACLHEEQIPPPPEDMNPSNPDLVPYEQELRFEGDLYTPRWVRGHGNKREGWCGICKPGRWLVLKNSAYWYDKSFSHGISAATGTPFQEPLDSRRMNGNPDVWEGLCGSCSEWIPLVSSKKKGTTWFRHAYKCHTHPKIKDAPKRRRDNSHNRIGGQVSSMEGKIDSHRPVTPQMSTPSISGVETPPNSVACFSTPTSVPMPPRSVDPQPHMHIQQQRLPSVPPPLRLCSVKSQPTHLLSPVDSYANMI